MLLKELKLENIRSYNNQVIEFPAGSSVLSGDIGSGKSTILLAVEFALFGASRPDLPAELLLRKGTVNGSVELTFSVEEKQIVVKRNLKKEKDSVRQTAGHLIQNGIKKELTPVEMKSQILTLLGYPESKNKNYIFRYTVYTPQEDMKLILQENEEIRLDALRKIFNIEKYKTIRDNLQIYLKSMRADIVTLRTRIEPLEERIGKSKEISSTIKDVEAELISIQSLLKIKQEYLKDLQEKFQELEKKQKEIRDSHQRLQTNKALLAKIMEETLILQERKQKLQSQIKEELPFTEESLLSEIKILEQQRDSHIKNKSILQEKIKNLQTSIKTKQEEISNIDVSSLEDSKILIEKLSKEITEKESLEEKKKQLSELMEKTNELITRNRTLIDQSSQLRDKIMALDSCPTCQQNVSIEHKEKVQQTESSNISQAEKLLQESHLKRERIITQQDQLLEQIQQINEKEKKLAELKGNIKGMEDNKNRLEILKESLKSEVQENNLLMKQMAGLEDSKLELISNQLKQQQVNLEAFRKKKLLQQQLEELQLQVIKNEDNRKQLQESIQQISANLPKEDFSIKINETSKFMESARQEEKELAVKEGQYKTKLESWKTQEKEIQEQIGNLITTKNRLIKSNDIYSWLEDYFIKLMQTIEKQVMVSIHHLFNQLFQEWFSILIDDESMSARLDDHFSPIIEQNGYEIGFGNLSGGEKTSASLAYRLALNKVINDVIHQIKTKNLLILDEPTDGFSSEQLDKVREVLDRLDLQQIIIVSHEAKIESFVDNVLRISKSGVSQIQGLTS